MVVVARRRRRAPDAVDAAAAMAGGVAEARAEPIAARIPSLPPLAGDENVPRWRRPSVAAARYGNGNTSTMRTGAGDSMIRTRPARVFAEPTEVLGERMAVRYGVPLLNQPDESFGRALGNLSSGDQVEILDHGELWANVITPTGAAGWVPTATLGPPSGERETDAQGSAGSTEPAAAPQDVEPPSLEALLEATRRAREHVARGEVAQEETTRAEVAPEADSGPAAGGARRNPPTADETADRTVEPGASGTDGRRPRERRRPKARSTTRRT